MDMSNILDSKIIVRLQYVNLENNPEHKYVTIVTCICQPKNGPLIRLKNGPLSA